MVNLYPTKTVLVAKICSVHGRFMVWNVPNWIVENWCTSIMEVYCGHYYQNIFMGKVQSFYGQTNFNGQKPHVFVLSTCFHGRNTLRFGKHFHGQSTYNIFIGKLNCMLYHRMYVPPR